FIHPEEACWFGGADTREPGDIEQQHDLADVMSGFDHGHEDRLAIVESCDAELSFEQQMKHAGLFSLSGQDMSGGDLDDFSAIQAADLFVGELGKEGSGPDLLEFVRVHLRGLEAEVLMD